MPDRLLRRGWSGCGRASLPDTDNPDAAQDLRASTWLLPNVAPTIKWRDLRAVARRSKRAPRGGDYSMAPQGGQAGSTTSCLNERIVALYLSADGAGLLALRQSQQ